MKEIKMVDLYGQYLEIKDEIDSAIQRAINSTAFIRGNEVRLFEEELCTYTDACHTIACGNGTDALQVALMALELDPGDEVITTPFTFISTIEVIRLLRLKPVLVDVREDTFNLDASLLGKAVTSRTRAIVPVHLFGQCAHMEEVLDIAGQHNLFVIEDAAQAIGSEYTFPDGTVRKAGTIGHMGTTSFFPSKNLGAFGDGGALFTDDTVLGKRLRALVNHGMSERYYYDYVGVNSRLDTLQAAILRIKLKYLEDYHRSRQRAADLYDRALSDIPGIHTPVRSPFSTHVYHQYTLRVPAESRDGFSEWLKGKGIPSAVYYPLPLHMQKAYSDLGYREGDLPVSEKLSGTVLSLPMHTELEDNQLSFIADQVRTFFN